MMSAKERYLEDVAFKNLVDMMIGFVMREEFTPSEVRLAALVACIKYEEMHIGRLHLHTPEINDAMGDLYKLIEIESKKRPFRP